MLFVAGNVDQVAGYETGTRALYTGAVNADRYLLTFLNAGHNAAAPYPVPTEVLNNPAAQPGAFAHYADAVWDTTQDEQHPPALCDRVLRSSPER